LNHPPIKEVYAPCLYFAKIDGSNRIVGQEFSTKGGGLTQSDIRDHENGIYPNGTNKKNERGGLV
jgi:hypothetical protein